MSSSVEFKNIVPTRKVYQDIRKLMLSKKTITGVVKDVKVEIKKKTKGSKDYKNKPFEDLTAAYKKRKSKLGLGSKANMKFTGKMLGAMKTKVVSAAHGKIFIAEQPYPRNPKTGQKPRIDTRTLANVHNTGTGKMPKRTFMNVSESFMKKMLKKWWDKPILKILGRG